MQPVTPLPSLLPPAAAAACTLSLLAAQTLQKKKKEKRIYANGRLKNECSPPLQCAEERRASLQYFLSVVDPQDNN